jgi:inner membrane protein
VNRRGVVHQPHPDCRRWNRQIPQPSAIRQIADSSLGGAKEGILLGAAVAALYGFLYLLLRLEDYALLAGSPGLFAMLAVLMLATRRVNWYELRLGTTDERDRMT